MRSLSDYLDLTVEQARSQWGQILRRQPRKRQEAFTPVEAILCYGLFFVVDPHRYGGGSMLVASHIKPWAQCDSRERLDVSNGVTACGVHDAAFDTGLITVNGGLRVHMARKLQVSVRNDPGADNYFGTVLRSRLILPADGVRPGKAYLEWHQQRVYVEELAGESA